MYQWIRLDKLYKLTESFLQIFELFFKLITIFLNHSRVARVLVTIAIVL